MSIYFDSKFSPNFGQKGDIPPWNRFAQPNFGEKPIFPWLEKNPSETEEMFPYVNIRKTKVDVPAVGNVKKPFESKTMSMMYKIPHKTSLLDIAQNHLGIQEVTPREYQRLSTKDKNETQMHLIGKYGNPAHQWCAHTVSHIAEEAGMDIDGHKAFVQSFIDWGKKNETYRPINTNKANKSNYKQERTAREKQIEQQIKTMHEGDFIIWKTSYVAELPAGKLIEKKSSHIGILESVNKDGTITVIEGNANEFRTDTSERELVKNYNEGAIGAQDVGDFKEVNRRDGLIRKVYTAKELAAFGYSGFIDNSRIVK